MLALFSLSSVIVGLAERAVEEFSEFTRDRRSRGQRVADFEAMQIDGGGSRGPGRDRGDAGEHTIDRNTKLDGVRVRGFPSTRSRCPAATPPMRRSCLWKPSSLLFHIAGGSALFAGNPLHDVFRDTMAACAHLSLAWHRAAPPYGALRLGQPVDFDLF